MNRISSRTTVYYKWVFPVFWFGFLAFFIITTLVGGAAKQNFMFLVIPCALALFGFVLMKKLVWDLADEVYDAGNHLVVRNGSVEDVIQLSEIMNVSVTVNTNPQRVSLRLARSSRFGNEIAFSPIRAFSLNPFAKNEIAEDLIVRVDRARARRAV